MGGEVVSSCNKHIGNYSQNECLELFYDITIENVWNCYKYTYSDK